LIRLITLIFIFTALATINVHAGLSVTETDTGDDALVGFFDLRDRESFIQITNTHTTNGTIHIQLFDVGNLCNENNFFDVYTPNDTHVYNLRDIATNDGNPSGVLLPDNAYGIFVASYVDINNTLTMIGNQRILDSNGYEYRTNLNGIADTALGTDDNVYTYNFNTKGGVTLSDVVGITLDNIGSGEVSAADIVNTWTSWDIDIFDLNEVPFSCRNVIFACTDQNNPQLEALLEESGNASVASFEYGINEALPHSKGGELLCPNNVISEGFIRMIFIDNGSSFDDAFTFFVGLNNGNGRGSMDMMLIQSSQVGFGE